MAVLQIKRFVNGIFLFVLETLNSFVLLATLTIKAWVWIRYCNHGYQDFHFFYLLNSVTLKCWITNKHEVLKQITWFHLLGRCANVVWCGLRPTPCYTGFQNDQSNQHVGINARLFKHLFSCVASAAQLNEYCCPSDCSST